MYMRSVRLFSFPRVLFTYCLMHVAHEEVFIKRYFMDTYRVNLNDLFDQDETFLFQNQSFRRLIKRTNDRHAHLVNQNFDIAAVTMDPCIAMPTEAEKLRDEATVPAQMTSKDVMSLFSETFNLHKFAHNPF